VRRTAAAILITHTVLLGWTAFRQSPTFNEMAHLAAGVSYWRLGGFDIYAVNPPLTRLIAAVPVILCHPNMNWEHFHCEPGGRPEFQLGWDFMAANAANAAWFCTLARWACLSFSLFGGVICFKWARELWGAKAALLALIIWCFSPDVLAHAALMTPDAGATATGLAASYAFWRWLKRPAWLSTVVSGTALGLAELTKFTWLVLFILWPVLWISWRVSQRNSRADWEGWKREGIRLVFMSLLAIYIINWGYAFEGWFRPLGEFKFVSQSLAETETIAGKEVARPGSNRFVNCFFRELPVPLPKNFVRGLDLQKKDFETYPRPSYLRGTFREHGWWYFYLYGLAIKLPLGLFVLLLLACGLAVFPRTNATPIAWRDTWALLAPAAVILGLVSSQTAFTIHLRYVMPALPFLFIWCSRAAQFFTLPLRPLGGLAAGASIWFVASSLWIYPHSLSYFNELVGGPKNGSAHLLESSLDWGQDLNFLKDWLTVHPEARPLKMAYFGGFDPRVLGIDYEVATFLTPSDIATTANQDPRNRWCAISASFLRGSGESAPTGDGHWQTIPPHSFAGLAERRPDAQAGYSILLFRLRNSRIER
jgi:hypothetical protein